MSDDGLNNNFSDGLDGAFDEELEGDLPLSWGSSTSTLSMDDLLQMLIQETELPSIQMLSAFSDLSRADQATVQRDWPLIPVERRRQVVARLVTEAEENLDLLLGRVLRVALTDEDEEIRRMAIAGLWEDTEPDLVSTFAQMMLNDPETSVRAAAAKALGVFVLAGELDELDTSLAMRAEEALLSVLQNEYEPVPVQAAALESIAFSGEVGVRQLIEDAYYSAMPELRVSALVAMGNSSDLRWRGLARAELLNPEAAMRREAARTCGELEIKAALQDLLLLLEDDDGDVRLAAIFALGRIGGKDAQEALRIMEGSDETAEAEAATLALEEMLFFAGGEDIRLYDEAEDEQDDEDDDWDRWNDDDDLGEYGD